MAISLDRKTAAIYAGAALLRLLVLVAFPDLSDFLGEQVEISTPISSFKRLQEGLFLYQHGLSPYDGGVYHQAPLLLVIFEILPSALVFVALDLSNAASLHMIAEGLHLPTPRFRKLDGSIIAAAYLFNPFTILSCLGKSTSIFTNTAIIQAVLNAQSGNAFRAMFSLAIGTYLSMYPGLLLPPTLLMILKNKSQSTAGPILIMSYLGALAALLSATLVLTDGFWDFISSCYGAQLTVTDLTPNVGLWWYFFIEIFDSFRDFFIGVFWLHLAGYVGGLTLRLQDQPLFVITSLLGLFAIFKPYPSIADVSLYLGFLPMYSHILPLTRYTFIAASVLLYSTLLGPAFYHLWIYAGSGNANFFYAITLVWSLGLTILVGDTLFAVLRDEWEIERPEMRGKSVRQI
ncbi:phosphatidylinositol glycan, class U [Capronia epimyces CBS 606.96]|uniref:Phosphatidylinositol glycan, class U n=1 Tax=Capronia epimyces CBS 606.96 TaxID=1182542 RepID=W9YAP2_9EURO|nr:phosphatidylinositol glycan, class U [Capronia epimyces CBS 606.96]EXJ79434.1 phosphatidylinositol glycan, class U [Capronia epimyces CBS 606.96]